MRCGMMSKKRHKLWRWKALDAVTDRRLDGECGRRDTATVTKMVERLAPWDVAIYIDGAASAGADVSAKKTPRRHELSAGRTDYGNYAPLQRFTRGGSLTRYPVSTVSKLFFTQRGSAMRWRTATGSLLMGKPP